MSEQVDELLDAVREILGAELVGAYLFGSATLGGLRPHSDLDILVVSARPTTREEKRRLADRFLALSGGGRRPLELTVVVQSDVRPWRYPPRMDLQYGEWYRGELEAGDVEPWATTANPDLASLITMVLQARRPLLGPPPAEVFHPVPPDDYRRAMTSAVEDVLRDLHGDTRNALLTLARIWSTVATGTIRSKDGAADWALRRLPDEHRPVLAHARAVYLGEADEDWRALAPQVEPHAAYVVGEIERLK